VEQQPRPIPLKGILVDEAMTSGAERDEIFERVRTTLAARLAMMRV
jgi:hypothetical protein